MSQAAAGNTTRRALMGTTLALPAIIATPVQAEAATDRRAKRRAFIEQIAYFHPRGRMVATHAMSMDIDPDCCVGIQLYCRDQPEREPVLYFRPDHRPGVEVIVNAVVAYEHGRVL